MAALTVEIVTPIASAFKGEAVEVVAPGLLGEFGVLPGHAAMLAVTRAGIVTLREGQGSKRLVVGAGFAEVGGANVTLLVESCEAAEKVDKEAAKVALAAAEQKLAGIALHDPEWELARKQVDLAQARTLA
jgi:F-type H+-transporting ATPase subunit epsilon